MDFFVGLERGLGPLSFDSFYNTLTSYLGAYWLMLRETRKRFYFKRHGKDEIFGQNLDLLLASCRDGHVNILDYMLKHDWSMINSFKFSPTTMHLSVVKWAEQHSSMMLDAPTLVENACKNGYKDIVAYGLERHIFDIRRGFDLAEDIEILDLLLSKCAEIDYLKNGGLIFSSIKTEAKLNWVLNRRHFLYFKRPFEGVVGPELVFSFIDHANKQGWTNTRLIRHVIERSHIYTSKYSRDKCDKLTDAVARALPSCWCECGDPDNHERRHQNKRIKF